MATKKLSKTSGKEFDDFLIEVGERLKKYRKENGYTSYEQFAFDKEIGRAQYGKYEKGTEDMRLSSLHKVLESLDVSWGEFFKGL
jgi:transcriptional regulator with XRE-family HTH domain